MDQSYNIYLTGEFSEGTDPTTAIAAFAKAAGLTPEKAQALFDSAPSLIKKSVPEATASAYQAKLESIGVLTRLEAIAATESDATTVENVQAEAPAAVSAVSAGQKQSIESTEQRRHVPFIFTGEGYEYFKIWIVNILLVTITLGLYSPWAKVRNTQYFYGNTSLEGASFAFTADPVKMLIGRLIALGLFIAYIAINALAPLVGAAIGIGLIFVVPWVVNRSLAFYARNTTYRNIRFAFSGDYWGAFKAFILWPLAGMLSLMILLPIALKKQQQFIINNHRYGNKSFSFEATNGQFYRIALIALGILIGALIVGGLLTSVISAIGAIAILVGYFASIVYFMVNFNNLIFNNTSLADHNFKANYEFKSFAGLMLVNFLLIAVTLGLYLPWAMVKLGHYAAEHTAVDVNGDLDKFAAISQPDPSAFGEEFGDVFDMEVGF